MIKLAQPLGNNLLQALPHVLRPAFGRFAANGGEAWTTQTVDNAWRTTASTTPVRPTGQAVPIANTAHAAQTRLGGHLERPRDLERLA
jgi:hypothetical protein